MQLILVNSTSADQIVTQTLAVLQRGGLVIFPTETTYGAGVDATNPERMRRIFRLVERTYMRVAQSQEISPLAARFQAVGDLHHHHAHGDVSVSVQYLDHQRPDDVGVVPFDVKPEQVADQKRETRTSRPDVNAMKVLRASLRTGVLASYKKLEPRIREGLRERADMGHVGVTITVGLRSAE